MLTVHNLVEAAYVHDAGILVVDVKELVMCSRAMKGGMGPSLEAEKGKKMDPP